MRQRAWAKKAQAHGRWGAYGGGKLNSRRGLPASAAALAAAGGYRRLGTCRRAWVAGLAPGRF